MKKLTAAELKSKMILAGIKQVDLCNEWKVPRSTMSQLVAGRLAPTPETRRLQKLLAKKLHMKPEEMPGD
jgi:plasmid maintenance system antidote protein VapI